MAKEKARIKTKLKQKVSKKPSHNQSEDLAKLTEQYNAFCTRLQELLKVRFRIVIAGTSHLFSINLTH